MQVQKEIFDEESGMQTGRKLISDYEEVNWTSTASLTTLENTEKNPFSTTDESFEDDIEDNLMLFKDFSEPEIWKTGFLIPLNCGHNGHYSDTERTILEIHLMNAGFINQ